MARLSLRIIDCTSAHDLLGPLPFASELRKSSTLRAILDDLDQNWVIEWTDIGGAGYQIDVEDHLILIDTSGLSMTAIRRSYHLRQTVMLHTISALRAAWAAEREGSARAMYRPDLWTLIARVIQADIAALSVRIAYELRASEKRKGLWRHILGDDLSDIASAYARALGRSTRYDNPKAMVAAFKQWFLKDTRIAACDNDTLCNMDACLGEIAWDGYGHVSEGAIKCLTLDPASGVSYLGNFAGELSGNPAWADIADPVNQTHFMQIIDEIGTKVVGNVAIRDPKLAARLFPNAPFPPSTINA